MQLVIHFEIHAVQMLDVQYLLCQYEDFTPIRILLHQLLDFLSVVLQSFVLLSEMLFVLEVFCFVAVHEEGALLI